MADASSLTEKIASDGRTDGHAGRPSGQATALMMFANYFGGSLFASFGKTVFSNCLIPALQGFSLLLNVPDLINAGATGVRLAVSEEDLPGVLLAFNQALTQTFVSDSQMDLF